MNPRSRRLRRQRRKERVRDAILAKAELAKFFRRAREEERASERVASLKTKRKPYEPPRVGPAMALAPGSLLSRVLSGKPV